MALPVTPDQVRLDAGTAAAAIAARIADGCRLVLIDGLSASGKSTLAAAVTGLSALPVAVVRGDDFIRRGTTRWDQQRFVADVLTPLSQGADAAYRPWPWDADRPAAPVRVPAHSVLLLEGIAVSDLDAGSLGLGDPLVVWVDADDAERARRSRERAPHRFACWRDDWLPVEREWVERVTPWARAEIVVAG